MNKKRCRKCNKLRQLNNFAKRSEAKDGLQGACKFCNRANSKAHYKAYPKAYKARAKASRFREKEILKKLKNVPCADCGEIYHYCVMDFDHRPNTKKLFTIGSSKRTKRLKAILLEIKKCDIVCSNCHRIRTFKRAAKRQNTPS